MIYIPIVHTRAELGSLSGAIDRVATEKLGSQDWQEHTALVEQAWSEIEAFIEGLPLDYSRVRLYQDALPVCDGREVDIVHELAGKGSRNHALLLRLTQRGAALMGTESPDLLKREYQQAKEALQGAGDSDPEPGRQAARRLLEQRDDFIAQRINATLGHGETGLLFLGMLHSLQGRLRSDIQLIDPLAAQRERARGNQYG